VQTFDEPLAAISLMMTLAETKVVWLLLRMRNKAVYTYANYGKVVMSKREGFV
jgi:hypothetical protein